jgi:endonuclease YncB( thermonuclease family)
MRRFSAWFAVGLAAVVASGGQTTVAAEQLAGPISAEVLRVIDGDSIEVRARLWLGLDLTVQVRIRGIDTPETGARAECASEMKLAAAAKDRLTELAVGELALANITRDKYGSRVDADVTNSDGADLKTAMLMSGFARAYDGSKRSDWCELARLGGG